MSVGSIHAAKTQVIISYPRPYPVSPPLTVCGNHSLLPLDLIYREHYKEARTKIVLMELFSGSAYPKLDSSFEASTSRVKLYLGIFPKRIKPCCLGNPSSTAVCVRLFGLDLLRLGNRRSSGLHRWVSTVGLTRSED